MPGILTTSGNTSSQKSQTVGDFYDVIGRIGIISTLKVLSQTSQTSAIFTMSGNLAVLRIAIVARIPVSGNRKNPRFLRFLGQMGTKSYDQWEHFIPEIPDGLRFLRCDWKNRNHFYFKGTVRDIPDVGDFYDECEPGCPENRNSRYHQY